MALFDDYLAISNSKNREATPESELLNCQQKNQDQEKASKFGKKLKVQT